ncbi:MAG: GUN4 domain-containing protein [Leptolyngbya sp. SIO1E4]|nr:GUN4 domain-containing protein [Leptolyngbya sp. SIO1E4]
MGDWEAADQETARCMLEAVGRDKDDLIQPDEFANFPCADLRTIDRLWVNYSKGRFGFSVQKRIYIGCGAKLNGKHPGNSIWEKFGERVGWRVQGKRIPCCRPPFSKRLFQSRICMPPFFQRGVGGIKL